MKFTSALRLGTILAGLTAISAPAFAQDGIEIVTVTAAKREQNVQNVPISMNVVSQKELEKFNLSDLKDIAAQVPGLTINRGQTVNSLYLRGFGTGAGTNPALDQTVSLYVDGVYSGRAREYMAPLFDVSRLEVLRGPQGALLGKNTAAGALSIVTNNPTDEFEAGATVGYLIDRAEGVDAFGYISGPITDTLKARLALKIVDKDGWLANAATGTNDPRTATQSGRLTVEWTPSQRFRMVTKYQFDHTDQQGRLTTGVPGTTTRQQLTGFVQNNPPIPGEQGDLDNNNAHHFSNLMEWEWGPNTFVSQTGLTFFTSRSLAGAKHMPVETVSTDYRDSFQQYAQEFRLVSPTGQTLDWIVGFYADYSSYRVGNVFRYKDFPVPVAFNGAIGFTQTTKQTSLSAYATGTWNITDDFRVIGAVRGTTIDRDGDYVRYVVFGTPVAGFPGSGALPLLTQNKTESSFDPSITVQYDISDDINVYASWARGSKGGAFQATRSTSAATFYVKPERSTSYDIGVKSKLWNFLTLNVAGFFMEFKSLQVSQYVVLPGSPPGSPPTLTSTNAATAESKGVELVLNADLNEWIEGLTFSLSGAYTDNRFTDYPGAPCTFASTAPANGGCGTVAPPGSLVPIAGTLSNGQLFNGVGLSTNGGPQWTGTMALNYTRDLNDWLKFDGTVGADMQSHTWNDGGVYNPSFGLQPSYTKINFRAALGDIDDRWTLAIIGYNVFDVLSTSGTFTFPPAQVYSIDEGRRFTIQGSVKLN